MTKAPKDLESHFRWHGEAFTDGQIIDTITPRDQDGSPTKAGGSSGARYPKVKADPVRDPVAPPRSGGR